MGQEVPSTPDIVNIARSIYDYDPETGVLSWKNSGTPWIGCRAGSPAGSVNRHGYLMVRLDGRTVASHRVIWLMMTGSWPEGVIDHINRVKTDNRWENLRDVSIIENARNIAPSGIYRRPSGKWAAMIRHEGRLIWGGIHDTEEAAREARAALQGELWG